ncbi:MAG TPA: endonuclease domain-containing protein [Anaerolineales bacterium]
MPVKNTVRGQTVSYEMHERAKKLRRAMTPAEKILWKELRTNKLNGLHFRRQQIIDGYFADFYCHQHALIVEVDGSIHEIQEEYDAERDAHLIGRGFRILRFKNEDIFKNLPAVLKKIVEACSLADSPFPKGKGAGGIGQEPSYD